MPQKARLRVDMRLVCVATRRKTLVGMMLTKIER